MPRPPAPDDRPGDAPPPRPRPPAERWGLREQLGARYGGVPGWAWLLGAVGAAGAGAAAVVTLLVIAVGGAAKREGDGRPVEPVGAAVETKKAAPAAEPSFSVPYLTIQDAYFRNEFEADKQYRGKRGVVAVQEIVSMGRDQDGKAFLATHSFGHNPEPTGFFYFSPEEAGKLGGYRRGYQKFALRVEGTCDGKRPDGVFRGINGYEWRVTFSDCRIK